MFKIWKNEFFFKLLFILNKKWILVPLIGQLSLSHLFPLHPLQLPLLGLPLMLHPQIFHRPSVLLLFLHLLLLLPLLPFKLSLLLLLSDRVHELKLILLLLLHLLHKILGRGVHGGVLALVMSGSLKGVRDLFKRVNTLIRRPVIPRKLSLRLHLLYLKLRLHHIRKPQLVQRNKHILLLQLHPYRLHNFLHGAGGLAKRGFSRANRLLDLSQGLGKQLVYQLGLGGVPLVGAD